ncbi:hypothetical protein DFS33DRAFT_1224776, partial [Desarmillaria ectypa]
ISSSIFTIFKMVVGTIYLQCDGWTFLNDSIWGHEPQQCLGVQDPKLVELIKWGDLQLILNWNLPTNGTLLDFSGVMVKVLVSDEPNASIALAIHGSGVTSMLMNQTDNLDNIANKVSMCNVPLYVL